MIFEIDIEGDVDLTKGTWLTGAKYACQKIKQRLRFLRGEWMWDTSLGMPYYGGILAKSPNLQLIRQLYTEEILSVPNIVAVTKLELEVQPATRLLSVTFSAIYKNANTDVTETIDGVVF